jgi:hypothetical protein
VVLVPSTRPSDDPAAGSSGELSEHADIATSAMVAARMAVHRVRGPQPCELQARTRQV